MEQPVVTPFSDIFNLFLAQVTDYELTVLTTTTLEKNMKMWLTAAISRFTMSKQDLLDADWEEGYFNSELNRNEKYILAKCMVLSYLDIHVITEGNIKQALNSKDYRMYSPANQLKTLLDLQDHISRDLNSLMSKYSWNITSLKGRFKQ